MSTFIVCLLLLAPSVISGFFFFRSMRAFRRVKALHQRFELEDRRCEAAILRGDAAAARQHLHYMKEIHEEMEK